MKRYLTYCGLYCGACPSILIKEKGDGDEVLAKYCFDMEETHCGGCDFSPESKCEFAVCNREKGTICCAFCPEFPCQMIKNFSVDEWAHHIDVIENLDRIKEVGVDTWLEEQKLQWSCSKCGARTHWYQKKCEICGHEWQAKYGE